LGNVRLVITESGGLASIVQENHYYPFGMQQNGNWAKTQTIKNDYLYNGKELNKEIGLNWSDYGFRNYDAAIGRFTGVDPISDQFANLSTYNYASNSPILNIDLWGLQGVNFNNGDVNRMINFFSTNASSTNPQDCITCHNTGMRTLLNDNTIRVGSQADLTISAMQDAGLANETISFGFNDQNGNQATGNASANNLVGSIGQTILDNSTELEVGQSTVFGVSILDGFHTMTVTATNVELAGPTIDGSTLTATVFTLSDQGTTTTDGAGNKEFNSTQSLDSHLESYVTDRREIRTPRKEYEYKAILEIHQIKQEEE